MRFVEIQPQCSVGNQLRVAGTSFARYRVIASTRALPRANRSGRIRFTSSAISASTPSSSSLPITILFVAASIRVT